MLWDSIHRVKAGSSYYCACSHHHLSSYWQPWRHGIPISCPWEISRPAKREPWERVSLLVVKRRLFVSSCFTAAFSYWNRKACLLTFWTRSFFDESQQL
jgi:hypothetical protein